MRRSLLLLSALLIAGAAGVVAVDVLAEPATSQPSSDIGDEGDLAEFTQVAFVGVLGEVEGNESPDGLSERQFSVEVEQQLLGPDLSDDSTINDASGDGDESEATLERDQRYLFLGRMHPNDEWVTVVDGEGTIPIDSEQERQRLVEKWADLLSG